VLFLYQSRDIHSHSQSSSEASNILLRTSRGVIGRSLYFYFYYTIFIFTIQFLFLFLFLFIFKLKQRILFHKERVCIKYPGRELPPGERIPPCILYILHRYNICYDIISIILYYIIL